MSRKEDDERLFNFILYKFWGTDKELEEATPAIWIGVIIGIVLFIAVMILRK